MRKQLPKLALTATIARALTLTACEEKQAAKPTTEPPAATAPAAKPPEPAGENIKSVKIGTQIWMAENLNIETGNSKCYGDDPANCKKYGRLYDWETATKVCPSGWHLPSKAEWDKLIEVAGGEGNADKHLKAKSGWEDDGEGDDKFGFAALPGGYGGSNNANAGHFGYWWTSTKYDNNHPYYLFIYSFEEEDYNYGYEDKSMLYSVRCIKD
jgi:uncharacterized protein (TIGR02145 family)